MGACWLYFVGRLADDGVFASIGQGIAVLGVGMETFGIVAVDGINQYLVIGGHQLVVEQVSAQIECSPDACLIFLRAIVGIGCEDAVDQPFFVMVDGPGL